MLEQAAHQATHLIKASQRVLLISHIRPDGDAVGSLLGLGLALRHAGKQVQMVLADGVPHNFQHLPGYDLIRRKPEGASDLVCLIDCSDSQRIGVEIPDGRQPDLNIDHHVTNDNFGVINLVDVNAVASAEILAELIPLSGLKIDHQVASTLLTGIITDTIGFQTNNMTPKALRLAAELMDAGANLSELYRKSLSDRTFEAIRLWGAGLSKVEREGRLVWTTLTMEDRKRVNYPGRDDADIINLLSSVNGADIYMVFMEQPKGSVKVSWRSQLGFDVTGIASSFGGGGHPSASGAEIEGEIVEVQKAVLSATRDYISTFKK